MKGGAGEEDERGAGERDDGKEGRRKEGGRRERDRWMNFKGGGRRGR